ncbi:MAG: hypothetical protein FWD64_01010 [Acidobacteriaceae bacterium]|nr:hypothetical protein [Acidobacteriaceae bacterium]
MTSSSTSHLTHEQLCDLLLDHSPHPFSSDFAAREQHLGTCTACAEELSRLALPLASFREATTAFAQRQMAEARASRVHQTVLPSPHRFSRPLLWIGTAALAVIVLAPFGLRHTTTALPPVSSHGPVTPVSPQAQFAANSQESDEILLNEVDQDILTSVPSPMRPLEDPTGADGASTITTITPDVTDLIQFAL